MAVLLRWLAALNVLATVVIVLAILTGSGVISNLYSPAGSVEIQLIPLEPVRTNATPAAPGARLEIPAEFRPHDLSIRPWDELPDGRVRMRD